MTEGSLRMCILGGGGFLGQSLAKELQRRGHYVVLLDLSYSMFHHIVLDPARMTQVKGSVLDRKAVRRALQGCDACFHLAGYGTVGGASLNREMTMMINVKGTEIVIDECVRGGIKRLIYASSISVVWNGGKEAWNMDESAPYLDQFLTPYAESKCIAEKLLLRANGTKGLKTCAMRLRGIYGPGEIRSTQRTVDLCLKGLVKVAFEKSKPCLTQYSSGENVVIAMIQAEKNLRQEDPPCAGKPYNIVDGGQPVEAFGFWYPLMEGVGATPPMIK
ncbi:short-chain dehydrogenase/reductase family 42E member 1-like isoform X1, partial [Aphelenchoides avenae]